MNPRQQYILARDTIDMIRDFADNSEVLEYIESLCFSIARILEKQSVVEWGELASICDQRYYSLKEYGVADAKPLDVARLGSLYKKYESEA